MIINGQRYEAEPAVEAYVKDLQAMLREESEENCELKAENFTLKTENAQLEEKYQKATGVIATDSLPTAVDCYKLKKMCIENQGCRGCAFRRENFEGFDRCAFEGLPCDWNFGGADNE